MEAFERASLDLVPKIVENLINDTPCGIVPSYMLENYARCKSLIPDLDVRLFTPGGQVDAYGTFLLLVPDHRHNALFYTTSSDHSSLRDRLMAVEDNYDWTKNCFVGPLDDRFEKVMGQIIAEKGLSYLDVAFPSVNFSMTREKALNLTVDVPDGLELRPVTIDQASYIDENWAYRSPGTLKYLGDIIRANGGVALYMKGSDEMLSWCFHSLVGGVGMIQTAETHRNKGYGSIVGKAMTKLIAQKGKDPQAQVELNKPASLKMFKKMGYTCSHTINWHRIGPVK